MEVLSAHLKSIRVPCAQDFVYKDECVYSYDTPVCVQEFSILYFPNTIIKQQKLLLIKCVNTKKTC